MPTAHSTGWRQRLAGMPAAQSAELVRQQVAHLFQV
jgi:hypothetical protein